MIDGIENCGLNRSPLNQLVSGHPVFESVPALSQLIRWGVLDRWLRRDWRDWRDRRAGSLQENPTRG